MLYVRYSSTTGTRGVLWRLKCAKFIFGRSSVRRTLGSSTLGWDLGQGGMAVGKTNVWPGCHRGFAPPLSDALCTGDPERQRLMIIIVNKWWCVYIRHHSICTCCWNWQRLKSNRWHNDTDEPRFALCQHGRRLVGFSSVNRKPVNRNFFRLTGFPGTSLGVTPPASHAATSRPCEWASQRGQPAAARSLI